MKWWQKKYFFGWENCKWFVREIRNTFSNIPSYFSRKRIESFFIFLSAMIGINIWYYKHINEMTYEQALAVFIIEIGYSGYQTTQIRKDILNKIGAVSKEESPKEESNTKTA